MSSFYTPDNWFWLADDGRVFGSRAAKIVTKTDAAFSAWTDAGNVPTPWPRDLKGKQTNAALTDVLSPYGMSINTSAA